MLECVVNVSEGRDASDLEAIGRAAGAALLDMHADGFHNRSVFTLAGPELLGAALELARCAVTLLDLSAHEGVHPRLGVVDVVPFAPLGPAGFGDRLELGEAIAARDAFIDLAAVELELSCFRYGPEKSLPEIRRHAFVDLLPDAGPQGRDPRSGACCVGARPCLVAYNLVLRDAGLEEARHIARAVRSNEVRALGLRIGEEVQVSCNLIAPWSTGPAEIYDTVATLGALKRAELVGLVPQALLERTPRARWGELDLDEGRTIEVRLGA